MNESLPHLTSDEKQTEAFLQSIRPAVPSSRLIEQTFSRLEGDLEAEACASLERRLMQVRPARPGLHLWDGIEDGMQTTAKRVIIVRPKFWSQMLPALEAAAVIAVALVIATLVWDPPADSRHGAVSKRDDGSVDNPLTTIEGPGRAAPVSHRVGDLSEKGIIMQGDKFYRSIEREMIELHHLHIDGDPVEVERPRRERLLIPMEVY